MKKNMKQTMRILTLLALALFSSGRIWAASVVSMDVTGGQLKFFSDEACTTSISEAEAGSTVYIKAIPDYGYTGNGATFAAVASVGSNQAESRRAVYVDETLPFGGAVEVSVVDNTRGIYSLKMPDNTGVAVSATLATVKTATVSYVDEKYETHTVNAIPLDLTMTVLAADQWYFVGSDITFDQGFTSKDDEIEMMRNRCIVVADGATFTIGTKDAPLENDAFYFGGSLFLYGQKEATGKLSINSEKCGTDIGGCFVIANLDVDVTSKSTALSGSSNGNGSFIAGHPTKGNTVTVRSAGYGIYGGGCPVTIKYCNVEVTGATQDEAGEYGFCGGSGIYEGGGSGMSIIGSASGNNTVVVRSCSNGIEGSGCPVTIQDCTVDVIAKGGYGITSSGSTGLTINGFADGSNTVTVRCPNNGIYAGGCPITINNCDVTVTGLYNETTGEYGFCGANGIYEGDGSGININGCANGNTVAIRSNGNGGIYGSSCPVTIKNCTVDVISNTGGYGIYSNGGTGITIEGLEDGSSDVTVRCLNNGLYGWGYPIKITNCDVTVTGLYNETTGEYNPCGAYGIYDSGGSSVSIVGHTENGNTLTVKSTSDAIYSWGCRPNISNCDVDLLSTNGKGINVSYYGDVSITSTLEEGNTVKIASKESGVYGSGCSITITNCDVDVTSTDDFGLYATSDNGLSLTSTLEDGNKATVKSKNSSLLSYGNDLTIDNYTVDINSESYGIYGVSKMDITNSDVTIESKMSSIYFVGSNGGTISDSRITATTTGTKQDEENYNCYDGIFVPNGITISGSQLDVSAQEGNWGINVADHEYYATLSWTHTTDYVNVSSYNGAVKVAEGQTLTDGSSLYSGELTEDEVTAIGGKKLQPGVGVTFAAAGYATYYDSDYDLVLPAGMQARVVTDEGAEKGTLKYETIADGDSEQNIVPAGTAVMLKVAAADEEQTLALTIGSGAEAYRGDNLLNGSDTDTEIPTATGSAFYKLTYGDDNTTFGWYWGGAGGLSFTSAAHRAWLTLPASVDARFLGLPEGEATGITQQTQSRQSAWYTIGGVKLDGQPTTKGLYIKDGKKVVIK